MAKKRKLEPCEMSPNKAHFWDIEPNHGQTSKGTCKWCGTVKKFNNWYEVSFIGRDAEMPVGVKV